MTLATRTCGTCTLCCKVLGIDALDKPRGQWCTHCATGKGCTIYADRPAECGSFDCLYIQGTRLAEHWFPARSKMVVCINQAVGRIEIHVDAGRTAAWRSEPYYGEIKQWARAAAAERGQILVCLPDRTIVVLPDEDVDLGLLTADDRIVLTEVMTASGPSQRVYRQKATDADL